MNSKEAVEEAVERNIKGELNIQENIVYCCFGIILVILAVPNEKADIGKKNRNI
jgi:hypothetical protein